MTYLLPKIDYSYDALEPFIDKKTMEIHYTKHHQNYINNVNSIIKNTKFDNLTVEDLLSKMHDLPENQRTILKNNLGGYINHNIFWKILKIGTSINKNLKLIIENNFKDFKTFQILFEQSAIKHFGSGWTWLVKKNKKLEILSTINQDNPIMNKPGSLHYSFPILGIDLWEHAYYLKYQNNKLDYIKSFWKIINWDEVYSRFLKFD